MMLLIKYSASLSPIKCSACWVFKAQVLCNWKMIFLSGWSGQSKDAFSHKSVVAGGRQSVYLAAVNPTTLTKRLNITEARLPCFLWWTEQCIKTRTWQRLPTARWTKGQNWHRPRIQMEWQEKYPSNALPVSCDLIQEITSIFSIKKYWKTCQDKVDKGWKLLLFMGWQENSQCLLDSWKKWQRSLGWTLWPNQTVMEEILLGWNYPRKTATT